MAAAAAEPGAGPASDAGSDRAAGSLRRQVSVSAGELFAPPEDLGNAGTRRKGLVQDLGRSSPLQRRRSQRGKHRDPNHSDRSRGAIVKVALRLVPKLNDAAAASGSVPLSWRCQAADCLHFPAKGHPPRGAAPTGS